MALVNCISRCASKKSYFGNVKYFVNAAAVKFSTQSKRDGVITHNDLKNGQYKRNRQMGVVTLACAGALVSGALFWQWRKQNGERPDFSNTPSTARLLFGRVQAAKSTSMQPGQIMEHLPTYSRDEVASHNTAEKRIWVTYGNGVYDVTEYVQAHPGGNKILMAAGKSIEPYWNVYSVHKNEEIYQILETLRVGNITEADPKRHMDKGDPYRLDPERSPILKPCCEKPFNAEPPPELLVDMFYTPNHAFFVRNHLPVPCVQTDKYALHLETPTKNATLKYNDIKKMPKKSVTAVTQCAGNRRNEMIKVKPVRGLNWGPAAIGNAKWTGVTLFELLKQQKVDMNCIDSGHIVFEGLDKQPDGSPYGASIPIEMAKALKHDIIIAYEMNGTVLPRDHGYPLRVIIPGVVGARQVKWLSKIYFSPEESTSHWQRNDYKGFNSTVDWESVQFDKSMSIMEMPVISAICDPTEGSELDKNATEILVKGYAFSGGGRGIIRVDVSADGGKTWTEARLKPNGQAPYKSYAWTLWEADLTLPNGETEMTLVAKAVDTSYNVQPDSVEGVWNLRGVLNNAWHRVNVTRGKGEQDKEPNGEEKDEKEKEEKEKEEKEEKKEEKDKECEDEKK